ncbi:hypothetical protein GYMLUDRAFT_258437 [Collybiopsis luxurians FD-317 M1]|nr:hypothetical protein GYMLUDRAFT_258437 [Collybiopsis luxurians FD-317 M1]
MSSDQVSFFSKLLANDTDSSKAKAFVRSQTETLIKPATKREIIPPQGPIRLHALDLLMPGINVPLPMVFKITSPAANSSGTSNGAHHEPAETVHHCIQNGDSDTISKVNSSEKFEFIVEKLKGSLAEALELYPLVAGSIHVSDSELTIVCDGRGAAFMTEVQDRPYAEEEHQLDRLSGTSLIPVDYSKPLFFAKLTLFSCGTIVMIVSMYHRVADLTSYMDFIHAWAQLSRGEDLTIPETWSRNLNVAASSTIPPSMPGIIILPPSAGPPPMPAIRPGDGLRWFISEENLSKLKTDCMAVISNNDLPGKSKWISSADAFTALVWGAMTRARHAISTRVPLLTSNDSELESLGVAADGRELVGLGSSAPSGTGSWGPSPYFGNFNLSLAVYSERSDLLESTIEATSRVALNIRQTIIDQTTPEAIVARIAFLEAHAQDKIALEGDCRSTNWSKYDLTKVDFGFGEDVQRLGTGLGIKNPYPAGMFLIVKSGGRIQVATTVEKEADELLKKDALLTKYAEVL